MIKQVLPPFVSVALAAACSSSSTTTSAPTADASAPSLFDTCTEAELDADDHTANGADVSFPSASQPAQYNNHCVRIRVGEKVTFAGGFASHPLSPDGETDSPIPSTNSGSTLAITFDTAGVFSYHCDFHPQTMWGSVKVIP